jgi:hypothetical protein
VNRMRPSSGVLRPVRVEPETGRDGDERHAASFRSPAPWTATGSAMCPSSARGVQSAGRFPCPPFCGLKSALRFMVTEHGRAAKGCSQDQVAPRVVTTSPVRLPAARTFKFLSALEDPG